MLSVVGNAQASDGENLGCLVLAGAGIARLSLLHIAPDIKTGWLVPILENLNPGVAMTAKAAAAQLPRTHPPSRCLLL